MHKKEEALCEELGNKSSLGYCYWRWGLLSRERGDTGEANEKLKAALALFTDLGMPKEREAVAKELAEPQPKSIKKPENKWLCSHPPVGMVAGEWVFFQIGHFDLVQRILW